MAFCYFLLLPNAINFLFTFERESITAVLGRGHRLDPAASQRGRGPFSYSPARNLD
jgi:hypothetical protein